MNAYEDLTLPSGEFPTPWPNVAALLAAPAQGGGSSSSVLVVGSACIVVAGFLFFALRAVRIMRDRRVTRGTSCVDGLGSE